MFKLYNYRQQIDIDMDTVLTHAMYDDDGDNADDDDDDNGRVVVGLRVGIALRVVIMIISVIRGVGG